jgi:hypothetical protein
MHLKAELQQREVELDDFEDADPALASRDLDLDGDDGELSQP